MIPSVLRIVSFLLLTGLTLHAQTAEQSMRRTFRIFSVIGSFSDLKFDAKPGQSIGIRINRTLSDAYLCPSGDSLVLYREIPPPPESPVGTPPTREIAVELPLPPDSKRFIVVVSPAPDRKLVARVIDDSLGKHPGGSLRVINFSTFPAAISINDDNHPVAVGDSVVVPYGPGSTLVRMAVQKNSRWALAFTKERIARPGVHAYGFIFNYAPDPAVDDSGPPPPALFRFFTEPVPAPRNVALH